LTSLSSSSLTLGIVAHVDAGKTSLTERLLYDAGITAALGSVDAGTTATDSMELERRRGITIRAAVRSFAIADLSVNLVDTPGHPDFIAEVERSLSILDAAVLVLSSVEGVQPQTVAIWRALQRVGVPTTMFVNKIDRAGADLQAVIAQVRRRLAPHVVELATAVGQGRRDASVEDVLLTDESVVAAVAEVDDQLLARWVEGTVRRRDVLQALRQGVSRGALTPIVCGSAITGAGVPALRSVLTELMPPAEHRPGAAAGTVFAVDRDDGVRRAWIRLWSGAIRVRDRVSFSSGRGDM
jgi:ribosomal protection tetracycline resistance protein